MEEKPQKDKQPPASPERIEEVKQRFIAFQQRREWGNVHEMLAEINKIYDEHVSLGIIPDLRGKKNRPESENT